MNCSRFIHSLAVCTVVAFASAASSADRLIFQPPQGTANGKHIVLISGDEEYRSEESCPMLGKILSQRHGFKCTVLFAIDRETGAINPNDNANIPGTDTLADADLMILATRWRMLPGVQLQPFLDYINAGKPIIAYRTATHPFNNDDMYGGYDWQNFGVNVVGENWYSHHGKHKLQGGRAVVVKSNADHPVLRSVRDIFTTSDIYGVVHLNEDEATMLLRGAVTETLDPSSLPVGPQKEKTREGEEKVVNKNDPMMALAWIKSYTAPNGTVGKCFATTAGAAVDFRSQDLRQLIVNACYFLTDQDVPANADVKFVDPYHPSFFGFMPKDYFVGRDLRVEDFELGKSARSLPAPITAAAKLLKQ